MLQFVVTALALSVFQSNALAAEDVEVHRFAKGFVNVYALQGATGTVVVDAHYKRSHRWVARKLDRAGLSDDVTLLLLTHAHSDHAGGALALAEALEVPIAVGAGDVGMLEAGDHGKPIVQSLLGRLLAPTIPRHYPAAKADIVVEGELRLASHGVAATARVVGGHSSGSLVVVLDADKTPLSGDLVRGGLTAQHRPKRHFFHEDVDRAQAAVGELLEEGVPTLLPAHGNTLTAERLERWLPRRK